MTQLEIHIPANLPPPLGDEAGGETLFVWLLRGENGRLLRSGQSTLAAMPPCEQCRIVVPASRVLLSSVEAPARNRQKFIQALRYAVEDRIMADPESVHVAAGAVQENGAMPVAIIDRAWLRQVLDNLRKHGIKPIRAEIETLLAPCRTGVWSLIWRGNGGFVRQGPHSGLPLDGGDMHQPPATLSMAIAATTDKPSSIQLYLDGADSPNLEAWSSVLGVPLTASGTWHWPASAEHGINLLQGEFAASSTRTDWLPRLRPALILAGAILAVQVTFTFGDWARLKYEKHRLTTSMEQSFRKAFPEAKVVVDAPLQMRRNLEELRQRAGQAGPNDFLPLLAVIAPQIEPSAIVRSMDYHQGTLKIHLTLPSQSQIDTLASRLPQAQIVKSGSGPSGIEVQLSMGG